MAFWDAIRQKLGAVTRFPPPALPAEPAAANELKAALTAFHHASEPRFRDFFLRAKPLPASDAELPMFRRFERAGLAREIMAGAYRSAVRVFPLNGAMIVTDLLSRDLPDQVFSLMYEQVYIVRNMDVRPGDHVLELCLGSGVNSLFASDVAARVTGVDINPRALAFARLNAATNPGRVPIEMLEGSLFDPLPADDQYDLILINPPFELVPEGADHFLHSHGGEDGLDVVRACLRDAPRYLRKGGRFEMFTWSPGSAKSVLVAELVREAFPDYQIVVELADATPLDDRIEAFRNADGYDAWRARLMAKGYTEVFGVYLRARPVVGAGPGARAGISLVQRRDEIAACHDLLQRWD